MDCSRFRQVASADSDADADISMPNGCKSNCKVFSGHRHSVFFTVIYEFQLHATHGDAYYIGLNGIEFYDEHGERIGLTEQSSLIFDGILLIQCHLSRYFGLSSECQCIESRR